MNLLRTMPLQLLLPYLYPNLYALHNMLPEVKKKIIRARSTRVFVNIHVYIIFYIGWRIVSDLIKLLLYR